MSVFLVILFSLGTLFAFFLVWLNNEVYRDARRNEETQTSIEASRDARNFCAMLATIPLIGLAIVVRSILQ